MLIFVPNLCVIFAFMFPIYVMQENFHLRCIGSYKAQEGSFDALKVRVGSPGENFWKMDANGAFLAHFFLLQKLLYILILKIAVRTYFTKRNITSLCVIHIACVNYVTLYYPIRWSGELAVMGN